MSACKMDLGILWKDFTKSLRIGVFGHQKLIGKILNSRKTYWLEIQITPCSNIIGLWPVQRPYKPRNIQCRLVDIAWRTNVLVDE